MAYDRPPTGEGASLSCARFDLRAFGELLQREGLRNRYGSRALNDKDNPDPAIAAARLAQLVAILKSAQNDYDGLRSPSSAWQNETLCKLIYVNLRLIVQYEIATGYPMNFLADTFFPALPDEEKLLA